MLICLSLASVWPMSVDNYSSLALTPKLIMKDKQSSVCQLPTRIRSHMKCSPLSTELRALGLVSCQRTSNIELTCSIFFDIRLFYFLLMKRRGKRRRRRRGWGGGRSWGGGWRYLFMVETLPVSSAHFTAGVPISYTLSCNVVCVTDEAAGWGLTGCRGTERRLRHCSSGAKRKQSTLNKL